MSKSFFLNGPWYSLVIGVMVINNEGIPLKSTLDSSTTVNITNIELQMFNIYKMGNI